MVTKFPLLFEKATHHSSLSLFLAICDMYMHLLFYEEHYVATSNKTISIYFLCSTAFWTYITTKIDFMIFSTVLC